MARCSKCNHENPPQARFCGNCRNQLDIPGAASPKLAPTQYEESGGGMAPIQAFRPGDFKRGGAATTVQQGHPGAGQYQQGAPGRTILHEESYQPVSGWLVVLRSRSMPLYRDIPIFHGPNTLGKDPEKSEHMITDELASRKHTLLVGSDSGVDLTDLGSSNGTYVNNQQVKTHTLQKGDMVKIGKTTMVYVPLPPQL